MNPDEVEDQIKENIRNPKWQEVARAIKDAEQKPGKYVESGSTAGKKSKKSKENTPSKPHEVKKKLRLSQNPFIIFYLRLYSHRPGKHVTVVVREAARKWCVLPNDKKNKYIKLAREVSKRRQQRKGRC